MDLLTNNDTGPLVANKITRDIYEELSAQGQLQERELWFITSADSVVVDIDKIGTMDIQQIQQSGIELARFSSNGQTWTSIYCPSGTGGNYDAELSGIHQDISALSSDIAQCVTSAWVMDYVNDQISAALEAQV